jgi:outer membrane protein OmpA-like peptidoglycan-associated protein
LRQNPFLSIEVNGHTDIVGPDGYNLELSERRARAVMAYLVDQGVAPQRMELAYHGSRLPTADNETPDGRRQNRRVEFEVLEHAFLPRNP